MSDGPASKARQFRRRMLAVLAFALGAMCLIAPRVLWHTDEDTAAFAYVLISMPLLAMAFGIAVGIVHGRMILLAATGVAVGTLLTLLFTAPI